MDELLLEVWTMKEGGEPEPKRRCGRKVLDIFTWLQCFGIYVSIWGMQSPTSIPEFMAYMSMIVRINQEYAGMAWLYYDTLYCKHAALKKDTKWSVINTTIYAPVRHRSSPEPSKVWSMRMNYARYSRLCRRAVK